MDARDQGFVVSNPLSTKSWKAALVLLALAIVLCAIAENAFARGAYRTPNFVVNAPTPALAKEIGDSAEAWRKKLAIEWVGDAMPNWTEPCRLVAKVSPQLGAGGATTFMFDRGEVFGWEMEIQGSRERVLDSVLPHEITHTVFASYFRKPLPRWADEGACTTVEHPSEIGKQERLLIRFLKTGKGIPFDAMFRMTEYPTDVLPLYAQGHSLTQFLIERRGKAAFMAFLDDGMRDNNWRRAVTTHYGHESLWALQESWNNWVRSGRPHLELEADIATQVASASVPRVRVPITPIEGPTGETPSVYSATREQTPEPGSVYDASNRSAPAGRAPTQWR